MAELSMKDVDWDNLNDYQKHLQRAREIVGSYNKIADACELTPRAVNKWFMQGHPPRTEYTGETDYAQIISNLTKNQVKKSELRPAKFPKPVES
jgi:DNA-binding transcriptional regulator YdaS (Cro superfamily)